jgi:HAD superfamily hydrolase (TIGR01509 family)
LIKALIFDVGGVLAYDVWENLLLDKDYGVASVFHLNAEEVYKTGQELWNLFAHRQVDTENSSSSLEREYWDLLIQRFDLLESPDYFIRWTDRFIKPVEGMVPLLEHLQASGVKLAICSDNTEFWFRRQMDSFGLCRFFSPNHTILSSRVGVSKSSPHFEMFEAVVAALDLDKEDCILIDDRNETILRGLEFGLAGIIFPSHSRQGGRYLAALLERMGIQF